MILPITLLVKALAPRSSAPAVPRYRNFQVLSVANDRLRHRRIGDDRVSKADGSHSLDLQRNALQAAGGDAVHVYHDVATGARDDRPGLDSCMRARRAGDVLVVWKLARLGRFLYCFLPNSPDSGSD